MIKTVHAREYAFDSISEWSDCLIQTSRYTPQKSAKRIPESRHLPFATSYFLSPPRGLQFIQHARRANSF